MLALTERESLSGRSSIPRSSRGNPRMDYVLDDINWSYNNDVPSERTFFYNLVQAGNVDFVRQVLATLKFRNMVDELLWLLQLESSRLRAEKGKTRKPKSTSSSTIRRMFAGAVMATAWVVLTPLFYILHLLSIQILGTTKRSLSQHITLPLAFAALSQNAEMLSLFNKYNVPLDQKDAEGNNVFHYICDKSRRDSGIAIKAYRAVLEIYGKEVGTGLGHWCIMEELNNISWTPLEMAFHTASLNLLDDMVKTEGLLKKSVIRIAEKATESEQEKLTICELNQYNVTDYEPWSKALLPKRSSLLSLLSTRDYFDSTEEDIYTLQRNKFLDKWQKMKIRMMLPFTGILVLIDVAFTCLLIVFLVGSGGDQNVVPLAPQFARLHKAVVEARSNITQPNQLLCPPTNLVYEKVPLDECEKEVFESLLKTCESLDGTSVLIATGHFGLRKVLIFGEELIFHGGDVFAFLSASYLFIDILLRLANIYHKFADRRLTVKQAVFSLMGKKLPVSYLDKILNTALCVTLLFYYVKFRQVRDVSLVGNTDMSSYVRSIQQMSGMMVFILVLRVVSHIYSLQLMPGIGHFVTITFAMATTLLRFMVIYTFVLLAFGIIFHFIMRDPDCPAQKISEFVSVSGSCFAIFKLMLGQGDFYYDINPLVKTVYVVYTVVCSILLLNMIVGIMGNVVSQLSAERWIWAGARMRLLNEMLNTEALTQLFLWPFSCVVKEKLLRKAGFLVKRDDLEGEAERGKSPTANLTTTKIGFGSKPVEVVVELCETSGQQRPTDRELG